MNFKFKGDENKFKTHPNKKKLKSFDTFFIKFCNTMIVDNEYINYILTKHL